MPFLHIKFAHPQNQNQLQIQHYYQISKVFFKFGFVFIDQNIHTNTFIVVNRSKIVSCETIRAGQAPKPLIDVKHAVVCRDIFIESNLTWLTQQCIVVKFHAFFTLR